MLLISLLILLLKEYYGSNKNGFIVGYNAQCQVFLLYNYFNTALTA
jgi:hypothetical protein